MTRDRRPEQRWRDEWPFEVSRRERFFSWVFEGLAVAFFAGWIGAVVGLALAPWYGWDAVAVGAAGGAIIVVLIWLSLPSLPR